jgi:hypothetical protein
MQPGDWVTYQDRDSVIGRCDGKVVFTFLSPHTGNTMFVIRKQTDHGTDDIYVVRTRQQVDTVKGINHAKTEV